MAVTMLGAMGSRERPVDVGAARGRELTSTVLNELRRGRLDRNLSGEVLADAVGISGAQYSRIERGRERDPAVARGRVACVCTKRINGRRSPSAGRNHVGFVRQGQDLDQDRLVSIGSLHQMQVPCIAMSPGDGRYL